MVGWFEHGRDLPKAHANLRCDPTNELSLPQTAPEQTRGTIHCSPLSHGHPYTGTLGGIKRVEFLRKEAKLGPFLISWDVGHQSF